jgi:hypothetical protein
MKPFTWVTLVIITIIGLTGMSQIPLVQDLVTASGYSNTEVFAGMGSILTFFLVALAIFEVRD